LEIHTITPQHFFTLDTFNLFFGKEKEKNFECYYIFKDISYHNICTLFASTGIILSGGSNSKKHQLSPLQHRLSMFLICSYPKESYSLINESFHRPIDPQDKKIVDLPKVSDKKVQNVVMDFAKSKDIVMERLLSLSTFKPGFKLDSIDLGELNKSNSNSSNSNSNSSNSNS